MSLPESILISMPTRNKKRFLQCVSLILVICLGKMWFYVRSRLRSVVPLLVPVGFESSKAKSKMVERRRPKSSNETLRNWSAKYNKYVDDYDIDHLWVGELSPETDASIQLQQYLGLREYKVNLVISHCDKPIHWIRDSYIPQHIQINSVHIYSKCGKKVKGAKKGDRIIKLPNHGRCDHSNAYHLAHLNYSHHHDDDIIVFIKDNDYRIGYGRPWDSMIRMVIFNGFSCMEQTLTYFKYSYSHYHDYQAFSTFSKGFYSREEDRDKTLKFKSNFTNLGDFVEKMHLNVSQPFTPVCFGGIFAGTISRIKKQRHVWPRIRKVLERGDNIEEGHFVERLWAGLLTKPLSPHAIHMLRKQTHEIACNDQHKFHKLYAPNEDIFWSDRCGALIRKYCKHCTMPITDMLHDYVYYTDDDQWQSQDDPLDPIYKDLFPLYAQRRQIFPRLDSNDIESSD